MLSVVPIKGVIESGASTIYGYCQSFEGASQLARVKSAVPLVVGVSMLAWQLFKERMRPVAESDAERRERVSQRAVQLANLGFHSLVVCNLQSIDGDALNDLEQLEILNQIKGYVLAKLQSEQLQAQVSILRTPDNPTWQLFSKRFWSCAKTVLSLEAIAAQLCGKLLISYGANIATTLPEWGAHISHIGTYSSYTALSLQALESAWTHRGKIAGGASAAGRCFQRLYRLLP